MLRALAVIVVVSPHPRALPVYATDSAAITVAPALSDPSPACNGSPVHLVDASEESAERDAYFLTPIDGALPATDSASAGTAMATGRKTDAGNIAWASGDPIDGAWETIAETLRRERGFAIGIGSTVPFDHATPASFVSHNTSRNNYTELGREIVYDIAPDVVVGGGAPDFYSGGYRYLAEIDYYSLTRGLTAYTHVVTRASGIDGGAALWDAAAKVDLARGEKLFGYFGGAGGNFAYHDVSDSPGAPSVARGAIEDPTLAQVVTATLGVLNQDPEGFFAMFEQGDIDWSNHANDFAGMIGGVWDLDAAVETAERYVAQAPGMDWSNTLMIVTSDHSNSYMRLHTRLAAGDLPRQLWQDDAWTYPDGEVSYRTRSHTNELVSLSARGRGARLFELYAGSWYSGTVIVDNTHVYEVMYRAVSELGVDHIVLLIGDGMNINHEIAGSHYLYGRDFGLAWHDWACLDDGWFGFVVTWDVDTYERYAGAQGIDYDDVDFDPALGYDPRLGGATPFPVIWADAAILGPKMYLPLVSREGSSPL